jgi:hypothetical protein
MLRAMSESFVDLTYRGMALGRRVKLTQVRPSAGYLELPTPMPVGTAIAIVTDEGVTFDARVTQIHEQVAIPAQSGPVTTPATPAAPPRIPGMLVEPALASDAARDWWTQHTTLPDLPPPAAAPVVARGKTTTVRPRSQTIPDLRADDASAPTAVPATPSPAATTQPMHVIVAKPKAMSSLEDELAAAAVVVSDPAIQLSGEHRLPDIVDDGKRTVVMDAVDPELLEKLAGESTRGLVDDGKKTQAMEAITDADLPPADEPPSRPSSPGGSVKRRRKKR